MSRHFHDLDALRDEAPARLCAHRAGWGDMEIFRVIVEFGHCHQSSTTTTTVMRSGSMIASDGGAHDDDGVVAQ